MGGSVSGRELVFRRDVKGGLASSRRPLSRLRSVSRFQTHARSRSFAVLIVALLAACAAPPSAPADVAAPSPAATPIPTASPPLTPSPTPTTRPVTLKPSQVIVPLNEFPLAGYKVAEDASIYPDFDWHRKFAPVSVAQGESWDYWWIDVDVEVWSTGARTTDQIAALKCDGSGWLSAPPSLNQLVTAPKAGDSSWACQHTWQPGSAGGGPSGSNVFVYEAASRNVLITVQANPRSLTIGSAATLELLGRLATKQIEIIDRVSPR